MISRRSLLRRLAMVGAGVGAAWWLRERYLFPHPIVDFAGAREDSGWIALPDPAGLAELTVHVNGLPLRAVVDSGAQFSAIDQRLAQRLRLTTAPLPMLALGVSGRPSITHTVALDLQVGPMQVRGARAATLDLANLSSVLRRPFAILLGRDILQAVVTDLDWPACRMRFVRPEAFRPPTDARVAPTRNDGGALMIPVAIEGAAPVDLMVDTGATAEIALSEGAAGRLGLLSGRPMTTGRSVSLGGLSEDRVVYAEVVDFAGRRLTDVEVQIFKPSMKGPLPDGLLGVGVLSRYRTALDLRAGVMWLSGPEATRPAHRHGAHAVMRR